MSNGSGNVSKEKVQRAAKHQRWDEGAQAEFEKDATVQCLQPAILMKGSDRSATLHHDGIIQCKEQAADGAFQHNVEVPFS